MNRRADVLVIGGGVTLGSATGKLVSQLATQQEPIVDPTPFSPHRFQ